MFSPRLAPDRLQFIRDNYRGADGGFLEGACADLLQELDYYKQTNEYTQRRIFDLNARLAQQEKLFAECDDERGKLRMAIVNRVLDENTERS